MLCYIIKYHYIYTPPRRNSTNARRAKLSAGGSMSSLARFILNSPPFEQDVFTDKQLAEYASTKSSTPVAPPRRDAACNTTFTVISGSSANQTLANQKSPLNSLWNSLTLKSSESVDGSAATPPTSINSKNDMFKFVCNRDLNTWAPSST